MANIVGGVTSINNPRTNWAQTDKTKADFLKNKPSVANALKGTASGEAIAITDASPIEHEMGVKVRGKNLLSSDIWGEDVFEKQEDGSYKSITKISTDGTTRDFYLPAGVYTFSVWIKSAVDTNFRFAVIYEDDTRDDHYDKSTGDYILNRLVTNGKAIKQILWYYGASGDGLQFKELQAEVGNIAQADIVYTPYIEDISTVKVKKYGKNLYAEGDQIFTREKRISLAYPLRAGTYTISTVFDNDSSTSNSGLIFYAKKPASPGVGGQSIGNLSFYKGGRKSKTVTFEEDIYQLVFYATNSSSTNAGVTASFTDIQIEASGTATEYEPYIEPTEYPVNADGTVEGVCSIYPTTTLMTDTAGAVIDCTYNRDANKVITDLETKLNTLIATIGG